MPALRGKKLAEEILRQADRLEGKFRTAYLRSVLKLADDKELKKLLDDIDKGRFSFGDSVDARLNSVRIDVAEMNEIARQAIAGSAKITNQVMGLKGSFDVVNDSVIDAAKKLSVELSTNLTKTAKASLRQIIEDQLSGNISRQEAVRRITMEVGLLPQHAKAVANYRKTLISAGTPRGQANRMAEQYAKRLLKYRANMIARTEVARATGIGQTNFWRQMRDQGALPPSTNRVWITAMDERACEFCRSMKGEVATIDGGWETPKGYMEYPQASHPHCRCSSGITTSRPTKSGRAGRIAKVEEIEYDLWLSKVGDKPGHPFRGNQYTQANKHAKEIDKKLRTVAGDKVADTWKPLVQEAMTTWYGQGDMQAPITVKGKKILVGGREISAQGVLDTMADALGVKAISQGRGFGADDVFSKGDKPGHPFRGNQWTRGGGTKAPINWDSLYGDGIGGFLPDVREELEAYLTPTAIDSLEGWVNDSKWPKKYFKEVTDEEFTDHYDVLQSRLIEAGFPETVTITRMGTPNSSGNIRNGSAIEGWSGGNAEGNHYGMDTTVYVSKVPRKNIIGVGSLEEGEFFYINDGVITTTRA